MKCVICNRPIKRPYYFDGETYGIECWKTHALPIIEKRKQDKYAEIDHGRYMRAFCEIEVLKLKDLSKITSNFKLTFIPSVIEQFEDKGFVSQKQSDIISDMFNNKDWKNYFRLTVEAGLNDKQNLIDTGLMEERDFN